MHIPNSFQTRVFSTLHVLYDPVPGFVLCSIATGVGICLTQK